MRKPLSPIPFVPQCHSPPLASLSFEDEALGMSHEQNLPYGVSTGLVQERRWDLFKAQSQESFASRIHQAFSPTVNSSRFQKSEDAALHPLLGVLDLFTLGIFSGGGCSSAPKHPPKIAPFLVEGNLRMRVDLEGDPRLGQILFIRQWHISFFPPKEESERQKKLQQAFQYQAEIYSVLEEMEAKHVFVENLGRDFSPSHKEALFDFMFANNENLIPRSTDSRKVREQKNTLLLAVFGAGTVYGLTHPETFLHRIATRQEGDRFKEIEEQMIKKYGRNIEEWFKEPEFREFAFTERESWATREVIQFLRKNPGEKVVLIYGGAHSFCDDFIRADFKPRMVSLWWELPNIPLDRDVPEACP